MSGLVVVVLGVWGGLIPFIGPYFHYSFGGASDTWHYTTNRLWLDILPGVGAVLGGVLMICAKDRITGIVGAWLAMASGAWFVVGAPIAQVWEHGASAAGPIGAPYGGATRQILELVGYFYGAGVLIVGFSAFALARFVSRPSLVAPVAEEPRADRAREPVAEQPLAERPAAERPPAEQPVAEEPAAEQPAAEQPAAEEPATQEPTEQPTTQEPAEPEREPESVRFR
jgi:pyruvate/2-oxoglutarate dehydrogenase complex dihydrolipoamide acyltransferase (E2) component